MDEPNRSVDELIDMMERELERLEVSLETHRLVGKPETHPDVIWHLEAIADRKAALRNLQLMRTASRH